MTNRTVRIFAVTVMLSTLLAFSTHVLLQHWQDQVAVRYSHLFEEAKNKDKFSFAVVSIAGVTAIIPVAFAYWMLTVLWHHVPGKKWWAKGLVYGCILLIIKSELIRAPIMGIVMGVPPWLVGMSQLNVLVPNIIMGLVLAFGVYKKNAAVA